MKIILDTNVIIAAFLSHGLCTLIFEICIDKHDIIISEHIIKELKKNFAKKIKLTEKRIKEIIEYLEEECILCDYKISNNAICRDKDDDEILALAKDNKVKYIVTGDNDLLILKKYENIEIITPRRFWEISKNE